MTVTQLNHPLVDHKMGLMREESINTKLFRELVKEVGIMLTYEASKQLKTENKKISCWSGPLDVNHLSNNVPTVVPILRAGLGMLDGVTSLLPTASISVVGIKRNEETLEPESYYENLVDDINTRPAFIIDPMLATGGSLNSTIELLKESGCPSISCLVLVSAPEGIALIQQNHPDVKIFTAVIDDKLNDVGYILPGLGDAGDKLFGTV